MLSFRNLSSCIKATTAVNTFYILTLPPKTNIHSEER